MSFRSSITSVASIFAIALVIFMLASMTPVAPNALADGAGNEPQPRVPDTLGTDSTVTMPDAPGDDDPSLLDWIIDAVNSVF